MLTELTVQAVTSIVIEDPVSLLHHSFRQSDTIQYSESCHFVHAAGFELHPLSFRSMSRLSVPGILQALRRVHTATLLRRGAWSIYSNSHSKLLPPFNSSRPPFCRIVPFRLVVWRTTFTLSTSPPVSLINGIIPRDVGGLRRQRNKMPNSSSGSASTASASGNDIWSRVLQSRRQSYEALGNAELEEILYYGGWSDVRREAPPDLQLAARRLEWLLQYYFSVSIDENCSSHRRRHHFHRLNQVLAKIDQMVANRNAGGADAVQFDAVHADREHRAPANRWGPPLRQRSSTFTSQQGNHANAPTPMSIDGSPASSNSENARVSATDSSLTTQNLASHNAFHNPNDASSSSRISPPNTIQNQPCSATTPTYNAPLLNGMHSQYAREKPSSTTAIAAPQASATTNSSNRTLASATHHLGQTRRERTSLPPTSTIMSSSQPPPDGSARMPASLSLSQLQTNDQSQIAKETNGRASDATNSNDNMLNTATTVPAAPATLHSMTTKVSSPSTTAPPATLLATSSVQRAPSQMSQQLTAIPQGSSRDRPKTPATPPMNVVSDSSLDSMQSTKPAPSSKNGRRPSPTATDNYAVSGSAPSGSMSSAQVTVPSSSVPLSKPVTAVGSTTNNLSQNSISNGIAQTSNLKGIPSTHSGQALPARPSEASTVAPSTTSQHSSTLDASATGDTVVEPVSSDSIQMTPLTSKSTRAVTLASNNNLKQTSNTNGSSTSNSDPPSQTSQTPSTMYRSEPTDNSRSSQTQNGAISTSVESELHEPASRNAQQFSSQQPPAKPITPLVNGRSTSQGNHEFKNPYARPSQGMQQHQQNPYERRGSHGSTNSDDPQKKASSQNPPRRDYPSTSTETPLAGSYASVSPTYTRMTFQPRDGVQLSAPGYAPAAVSSARSPRPHDNSNSHRLAEIERSSASQPGVRTHTNSQPYPYSTTSRSDQRNVSSSYSSAGRNLDEPRRNSFDGASRARSTLINGHKEPYAQRKNSGFSNSSQQMLSNPYAPQSRGASTSHPRASAQSHLHEQTKTQGHSNEIYHRRSRSRSPTPIAAPSADARTNTSSDIREGTGNRSRSRSPTPNFAAEEPRSSTNQVSDRRSARETNLQRASSASVSNQHIPHPPFGRSLSTNIQSSSRQIETVDEQGTSASARSGKDIPREVSSSKETMRNGQSKHTQQNSPAASNQAPIALGTKTITIPAEFDRTKAVALYGGLQSRHEAKITFSPFQPSQRDKDHCLSRLAEWEPFWKVDIVSEIGRTWKIDKLERSKNDLSDAPTSAAEINFTLLKNGTDRIRDWGVPPKSPQGYCQGDCRLLLFMIPVKVDMKKRADTHIWPKGTFLTLDGVPQKLIQRKQQAHDPKLWYGMCEVLDVSQLIKQPLSGHSIQMCCVEHEQYFYCLAICQHVTPANLFVGEPLISLSREEATKRALEFAKPMICLGDDDEDGHQEAAGKVIFSLVCPISKAIMKKPVRGDVCAHFQCFDLLTFLESNVRTSGGRWRCASCEKFLSWRSLRYCGLTAVLLKEFEGLSSVVRDRVEFRADGKYRLLDETKARYNKKRKVASEIVTSSSNKRPTISTAQDAIEIEDDD